MRGEHVPGLHNRRRPCGLSLHVQGTRSNLAGCQHETGRNRTCDRIIPACAGNTLQNYGLRLGQRIIPARAGNTRARETPTTAAADHPRMRGEHTLARNTRAPAAGAGRGPTPGAPNAGRPPSEVRAALRQAFADRLPIITGIADDAMLPPTDRLRALEVLARHGLGTVTELGVDDVRDKLAATVAAIRRTVPPDVAAPLLVELRTVWTT